MSPPLILIGGPTASGKSALALALAEEFAGTVINADSMQVYRDLAVLTARPSAADEARAPHRLYGVLDAADPCSAARWRALAEGEIAAAAARGRLPILVGGTGLYFRALLDGLADIPPIPAAIRAEARRRHRELGGAGFHVALASRDPAGAARLAAGAALLARRLAADLPAMKAVGVPELARHLAGALPLDEAIRLGQQATRRYAKRQVTWFRHQMQAALTIDAQFSERLLPEIF